MAHGQDTPAAAPDETHVSPDGALTLLVYYDDDPTVAFAGHAWHLHGDMFPDLGSPQAAIASIVADILNNRRPIIECWRDGVCVDAWAPENNDFDADAFLAEDQTHRQHGEDWRVRYWTSA